jgi:hypothetical protein
LTVQLKWGSYPFDVDGVRVATMSERLLSENQVPYGTRTTFRVSGWMLGSGQSDLSAKQRLMEIALRNQYQDLILYQNDNARSATTMLNADANGGLVVTAGPNFPGEEGAEYATQRRFDFEVTGEFFFAAAQTLILNFSESLSFDGGGEVYIMKPAVEGLSQRQLVWENFHQTVIQRGRAVGLIREPVIPPSIWPFALTKKPRYDYQSPRRIRNGYQEIEVSWEYVHEWPTPLVGRPNIWTTTV